MFKTMVLVGLSAVGGTIAANQIDRHFGARIANPDMRGHAKTAITVGGAVGIFGVLNALV